MLDASIVIRCSSYSLVTSHPRLYQIRPTIPIPLQHTLPPFLAAETGFSSPSIEPNPTAAPNHPHLPLHPVSWITEAAVVLVFGRSRTYSRFSRPDASLQGRVFHVASTPRMVRPTTTTSQLVPTPCLALRMGKTANKPDSALHSVVSWPERTNRLSESPAKRMSYMASRSGDQAHEH